VINKTDLAPLIGADLEVMARDSKKMRGSGPFLFAQVTNGIGVQEIADELLGNWKAATLRV
jgi:urease accessory protein